MNSVNDWYKFLWDNDREEFEDRLDWLDNCVVIASPSYSANYFIFALTGRYKGKIIYCDHDGLEIIEFANSFNEFLEKYLSNPIDTMEELEWSTRYEDEASDIEWIPIEEV